MTAWLASSNVKRKYKENGRRQIWGTVLVFS